MSDLDIRQPIPLDDHRYVMTTTTWKLRGDVRRFLHASQVRFVEETGFRRSVIVAHSPLKEHIDMVEQWFSDRIRKTR